jgi:2-polyprenyl-3-methyl-5-hydroxy-6-metoxy-1,4-benzoquinol methylase
MKTITTCPVCESPLDSYMETKDFFGQQEGFELLKCPSCGLIETNPQPDPKEILKYYKSNSYVSHGQSKGYIFDQVYRKIQKRNHLYKYKHIVKHKGKGNLLLDYGAGNGSFATYMQHRSFEVTAVEPDQEAIKGLDQKIHNHSSLQDINGPFDVITSFHVVEHVHELDTLFGLLKKNLAPDGVLMLALPNYQSYDAQYYQEYWAGYDVPRHLHHFTRSSLYQQCQKFELKIVDTQPLIFDSYYVSLLSEQYKKSKFALIRGGYHGWKSNRKARKTGLYSSLLYIIKH